jgi:hypothetical protein
LDDESKPIYGRQKFSFQVTTCVLVCVPAAQVDLHHAYACLDEPARDEETLAPFLAAIAVAHALGLLPQIERILPAGSRREEEVESALTMYVVGSLRCLVGMTSHRIEADTVALLERRC